jgi:hypothetical protein
VVVVDSQAQHVLAGALVLAGLLACFAGYKLFKVVLGVSGFVAGGAVAWVILSEAGYDRLVVIAGSLLGALVGAVALVSLFYVGVFLFGASLGARLALTALVALGRPADGLIVGGAGVVSGLLTLIFRKALIIVSTALTGAWVGVAGAVNFILGLEVGRTLAEPGVLRSGGTRAYLILAGWLAVAVAGAITQFKALPKKKAG